MTFKTIQDIEDEKEKEEREKFKKDVSKDVKDIFTDVFKKEPKKVKRKISILKWIGILFLTLFLLTLVLGMAWLLRELIKSLFLGG